MLQFKTQTRRRSVIALTLALARIGAHASRLTLAQGGRAAEARE